MGDMLTLIEKAEEVFEEKEAEEAAQKLLEGQFTFDDFLEQMQQVKKMGSISSLLGMMPGVPKEVKNVEIDDREISRIEGMIHSMTKEERVDPSIIDGSRRARIAAGSGTDVGQISQLVKQFQEMQKMMKNMPGLAGRAMKKKKKKGKKGKGGGRVTPKGGGGPQNKPKQPFSLPGLDQ